MTERVQSLPMSNACLQHHVLRQSLEDHLAHDFLHSQGSDVETPSMCERRKEICNRKGCGAPVTVGNIDRVPWNASEADESSFDGTVASCYATCTKSHRCWWSASRCYGCCGETVEPVLTSIINVLGVAKHGQLDTNSKPPLVHCNQKSWHVARNGILALSR